MAMGGGNSEGNEEGIRHGTAKDPHQTKSV